MTLQGFHMLKQKPQFTCLFRWDDTKGIFNGPYARKRMAYGADTAYPSAYPGRIIPFLANKECLEKARSLNNLPARLLKLSILYAYLNIPVPFDTAQMMHIHIAVQLHIVEPSLSFSL
jgi:hypothetical protein